jgi:tRNA (guanosine-2'-O-)-methyltransferase
MEDFDISKPSALFFGTERDGLSEEFSVLMMVS